MNILKYFLVFALSFSHFAFTNSGTNADTKHSKSQEFSITRIDQQKKIQKPNIILLLADDMGWTAPACYGSDLHETPNIDRLAEQGVLFTNAYAACSVCSPTRASILSGQYPARLHLTDWVSQSRDIYWDYAKLLEPDWKKGLEDEIVMAELLKSEGYSTAHIGKWHVEDRDTKNPLNHGFDKSVGRNLKGGYFLTVENNPGILEKDQYRTDYFTDLALGIMREWREEPFFIYLAYINPHRPIQGKPELANYYKKKIKPGSVHSNPEYAAMIHSFDENVGRIMAELDKLGLSDNTLLVFTSDNGGLTHNFGEYIHVTDNYPLRQGKGSCYEGGVREPWIVRWPGVTSPGAISNEPISTIDLLPTFISAAGVDYNGVVDGIDLTPIFQNPDEKLNRNALFWNYPHYHPGMASGPFSSVRSGDWKLIHFYEDNHYELYNLANDIRERENLAQTRTDKLIELNELLNQWKKEVNAQPPIINPNFDPNRKEEYIWKDVK